MKRGKRMNKLDSALSGFKVFWIRYKRNKAAVLGLVIILVLLFAIAITPFITPYSPLKTLVGEPFEDPSWKHPMGTDNLGRDTFSGVLYGARVSLFIGFLAAGTSTIIGIIVGMISGYYGGIVDDVLMRFTEMFMVMPRIFLAIILVAAFGTSIWNVIFVIGIMSWPGLARLVRAEYLSLKEKSFVEAARMLGASNLDIMVTEILPNALPPVIVNISIRIASAILLESGMSFLGVTDPNLATWGWMVSIARLYIRRAWWMITFPGLAIAFSALGFNLIGDGFNDAINPRLRAIK